MLNIFLPLNTAISTHSIVTEQGKAIATATLKRQFTFYNPDTKELESHQLVQQFTPDDDHDAGDEWAAQSRALRYYDSVYPDWAKEINENYSLLHKEKGIFLVAG